MDISKLDLLDGLSKARGYDSYLELCVAGDISDIVKVLEEQALLAALRVAEGNMTQEGLKCGDGPGDAWKKAYHEYETAREAYYAARGW